jgi:hypothetical protein
MGVGAGRGERRLALLTEGVAGHLLAPQVNVLRVSLHPDVLPGRCGDGRGGGAPIGSRPCADGS